MFRVFILLPVLCCCLSCGHHSDLKMLQAENDSLKKALAVRYKPGFGEFMSGIQQHHAKLWFAGINRNWELADFELHEIAEALDDIRNYEQDRKETSNIGTLEPALDSLSAVVLAKDESRFRSAFSVLTASCNHCHELSGFGFNRVIIPVTLPVPNQDFTPVLKELQATNAH